MLFSSSKASLSALVAWCHSLRYSLSAGLDPVKVFKQQAKSGPRAMRPLAKELAAKLSKGSSLEDALEPHRNKFPPLFLELVAVGEQTGRLEDTFHELGDYYQTLQSVRRDFISKMIYPLIQYLALIGVLSFLLIIFDILGIKMDPLGFGLSGTTGAFIIAGIGFGFLGVIGLVVKIASDDVQFRAKMEGALLWVPGWGAAFLAFAVMRFAVALRMCAEAGLRMEKTLHYCFRATANSAFQQGEQRAIDVAKRGGELLDSLKASRAPFPKDFLDMILTGEETGNVSEVMDRVAKQMQEEAERKLKTAGQFTSYAIYGLTALLLIFFIFRIVSIAYIGPLNQAAG